MATARDPHPPSMTRRVAGSSNSAGAQREVLRSTGPKARERRVQARHTIPNGRGWGFCVSCPVAGPRNESPLPAPRSVPSLQVNSQTNPPSSSKAEPLDRWIQTRLNVDPAGKVAARDAYADFCRWARALGIEPCTETRFGRDFTARIIYLGGVKIKRRDRAYYQGVVFKDPQFAGSAEYGFIPERYKPPISRSDFTKNNLLPLRNLARRTRSLETA